MKRKFYIKKRITKKPKLKFGTTLIVKEKEPSFIAVSVEDDFIVFDEKEEKKPLELFDELPVDVSQLITKDVSQTIAVDKELVSDVAAEDCCKKV